MATVADTVRVLIAEQAAVKLDSVLPSTTFDVLELDSLDAVEIAIGIEDLYHIEILNGEIPAWTKVADVIMYLDRVLKEMPEVES